MKRIAIDVRTLSKNPSGIGLYAYNFIKELIKFENIYIILITDIIESDELQELNSLGVKILSYGKPVKKNLRLIPYNFYIKKLIKLNKIDIFWQPNQICPINLRTPGCKIVVTIHDILPLSHPTYHRWYYVPYFYVFLNRTLKFVDGIVYNSENTQCNLNEVFKIDPKIKTHISYCIIESMNSCLCNDHKYFLYIGNLEKKKGLDILLNAFHHYLKKGGENKLILAGTLREKDLIKKIENVIQEFPNSLHYMGYISSETKNELLANCSCFVFPSRAEGFGIPPIEAIQFNKPIIVSDLPIFREILGDSVNYFSLKNDNEDYLRLSQSMTSYSKPSLAHHVTAKYQPEIRSRQLADFFQNL